MTFSHFSYPEELVSDNGPPSRSEEIKHMLEDTIKHCCGTPYWPRANGEIKRFMIPLMKVMIIVKLEDKPYQKLTIFSWLTE